MVNVNQSTRQNNRPCAKQKLRYNIFQLYLYILKFQKKIYSYSVKYSVSITNIVIFISLFLFYFHFLLTYYDCHITLP